MRGWWEPAHPVPDEVIERASRIRLALFDVDGVLTDGSLHISNNGEEYKVFNTQDGHGLVLLAAGGIEIGFITARDAPAVAHRARELGIHHFLPGRKHKLPAFLELVQRLGISTDECCFVGDDVVDVPVMLRCGLAIAVQNANHVVKRIAHWVTPGSGGNGAAREVCELLLYAQDKFDQAMEMYLKWD